LSINSSSRSCGQLAALVLRVDAYLATAGACALAAFFELLQDVLHGPMPSGPAQNP